ncbi:MAG: ABC transporter ATP-binding protein [Ginsengibacter sp.]
MMKIKLREVGKRFNREWIFRHLNLEFNTGRNYAITGPNGSGKSTLLQIIAGATTFSEGEIQYFFLNRQLPQEKVFKYISLSAPYMELIEEMTLLEFLNFHSGLKPWMPGMITQQIISFLKLENATHKQIRNFSSGMKQRVKLAQAIFSDVPLVLLDEPTTNLDSEGILLYKNLVKNFCSGRLVIVSSNDKNEYDFCEIAINLTS